MCALLMTSSPSRSGGLLIFICVLNTVALVVLAVTGAKEAAQGKGQNPAHVVGGPGALVLPLARSQMKAQGAALLVVFVAMSVPSMVFKGIKGMKRAVPAPAVADELVVLAYNNQNSYSTVGRFNGHCFARIVEGFHADYVSDGAKLT